MVIEARSEAAQVPYIDGEPLTTTYVVRHLPAEAACIAAAFTPHGFGPAEQELKGFLTSAADIPGLDGIALALLQLPKHPRLLVFSALFDVSKIVDESSPESGVVTTVSEALLPLRTKVKSMGAAYDIYLDVVHSASSSLEEIATSLETGEAEDPFLIDSLLLPQLTNITIALTPHSALPDATRRA